MESDLDIGRIVQTMANQGIYSFGGSVFGSIDLEPILSFFRAPLEDKMGFAQGITGYVPYGIENSGDRHQPDMIESYTLSSLPSEVLDNSLEHALRPSLHRIEGFANELSWGLLNAINKDGDKVDPTFFDSASFLRLVYYPEGSALPTTGKKGMRHGEHVDGGFITMFPYGVSDGLQYEQDGKWVNVEGTTKTLAFAGKIMGIMTAGKIPGCNHRVQREETGQKERLTIQYFITANREVNIPVLSAFAPGQSGVSAKSYFESYLGETMSFDEKPKLPVNFSALAPFWDLYETEGMNSSVIGNLDDIIDGPVLVVGSGQGIVSQALAEEGLDVTSVDSCDEMANYAQSRRGVKTTVVDAREFVSEKKYGTVVVSTGVINDENVGSKELDELFQAMKNQVVQGGRVVYAHFMATEWQGAALSLGIYGPPSTNVHFWEAKGDLNRAKELFKESHPDPDRVEEIFVSYSNELREQSNLIMELGKRYSQQTGNSPLEFISRQSGFFPFDLSESNAHKLIDQLERNGYSIESQREYNNNDTRVIITRVGV